MRPIGGRETQITTAALRFNGVSSTSLVAALRGTGEYAARIETREDREGIKRVLRIRGYTFQGRHIFGPSKDDNR